MSESDEGKPKEFFWLRARALVAKENVRRLRGPWRAAKQEAIRLQRELQSVCPHADIMECAAHEEFQDGLGFPPTRIEAQRRCVDCGLVERETRRDNRLFRGEASRFVTREEFNSALAED